MQRQGIPNAMWTCWIVFDSFDLELYPVACLVDHICVSIESQKIFKIIGRLPVHNFDVIR